MPPRSVILPGWGSATGTGLSTAGSDPGTCPLEPGVAVVGWSLGAMRALEAATQIELAGLVLVAATPQFVRRDGWRHGWPPRVLERMRARLAVDRDALLDEFETAL